MTNAAPPPPASHLSSSDARQARSATSPWHMPCAAWKAVVWRAFKETSDDNVGLVAAGVAFYGFLAMVPLLGDAGPQLRSRRRPRDRGRNHAGLDAGHAGRCRPADRRAIAQRGRDFGWQERARSSAGAATLYRYAPSRRKARWVWISPGSLLVSVLWLCLTLGFGLYVANFSNYNVTYGSLGAVVVLLTWLYLSSYVLVLGAELNSELERETAQDTTEGPARPAGSRGAAMADDVADGFTEPGVIDQGQPGTPKKRWQVAELGLVGLAVMFVWITKKPGRRGRGAGFSAET